MIFKIYASVILALLALMIVHMAASAIRDAYYILTLPPMPEYSPGRIEDPFTKYA